MVVLDSGKSGASTSSMLKFNKMSIGSPSVLIEKENKGVPEP